MQMLTTMREGAWRNAEALVNAPTPPPARSSPNHRERGDTFANTILLLQSYTPPLSSTTSRDAYCAVHKGDAAPLAYPFGTPTPYAG